MFGMKAKEKEKGTSPKDIMAGEIERLTPGQSLCYKLPPIYGDDLVIVKPNPNYPNKGKKYLVCSESVVDGKPSGKVLTGWDSDKASYIAGWVVERLGTPFA
ncbi:MAG: hypothetical protein PHI12_00205 [Dehalococcoidales bacterium]|nr:hypothetical protein [Dehalococcoidales bacterium]